MTDGDIAKLCRYCGQSIEMDYGPYGSGATAELASLALVKYFGYNKSTHAIYRNGYSPDEWENEIYQELAAGYPIIYSGLSIYDNGHTFIVDGYKDGLYHVNWGWGGWFDTYFVLTVMDSMGPDYPEKTYSEEQSAIVGVRPTKGGTLDYPLMTISLLELPQGEAREVTRGSANDNFYVPVSLKMDNSANSDDDMAGMGIALYKGKEKVENLLQFGASQQRPGMYYYGTYWLYFGAGLADGKYRIEGVYVDSDHNLHQAQGFGYRYIEAVIKGNKLTLTNYPLPGTVKLNKSKVTIQKGKTVTLKATVSPSTTGESLTWESSNTKIATVTSAGKVKGLKAGTATITCTSNSTGAQATCEVTVGYVKLDKTEVVINKGKTTTLTATVSPSSLTDKSVTWKSSNTKVATVTSKGKVKGVKAGTATITCTSNATGLKTTCEVTVGYVKLDQTEVTVKKGKTVTLKATVYPSSLEDRSVTWESSNTKIAIVSSKGKVKGVKAGTATITCTSNATGLKTACKVTVTASAGSRSLDGDDNDEVTEIDEVVVSAAIEPFDVYDLGGRKVLHQVTSLDGLPDGIYIVNGKKILKK